MSDQEKNLSDLSLQELFQMEAEEQCKVLSDCLLQLEKDPTDQPLLESLMRAAHSLKGAARIIDLQQGVDLSHVLEDVFIASQKGELLLKSEAIDILLKGVDLLSTLGREGELAEDDFISCLQKLRRIPLSEKEKRKTIFSDETVRRDLLQENKFPAKKIDQNASFEDLVIRISSEKITKLFGLASENQIESRWLPGFSMQLLQLKHRQDELYRMINQNREKLESGNRETSNNLLQEIHLKILDCRSLLIQQLAEVEEHSRRGTDIAHRLYHEILHSRMVPFMAGIDGLPRMVRDLARELDKKAELCLVGLETQIDRDILLKIEAPLNHLIRNALDHGLESPEERKASGKNETGIITINVYHRYGLLHIEVRDDGRGIDIEKIRELVVRREMVSEEIATNLTEKELLDFLFLPNFSTTKKVSSISGRGVGLDVVQTAIRAVRGSIKINTSLGTGTSFEIQLPLTLSVVRSLVVSLNGEPYAFPVVMVDHVLRIYRESIKEIEGRPYIIHENKKVGLVSASRLFGYQMKRSSSSPFHVVVLSNNEDQYGLIVDSFLFIQDLVVQTIDRRLGKIKDISAAAILEDGRPVLILDVEDLIQSLDRLISGEGSLNLDQHQNQSEEDDLAKRILVVDDSITVREVEREMLLAKGYSVEVAVDGLEAWNMLRSGVDFDLVVTDIDMPRMNGFELIKLIKDDPVLASIPVIIVSFKDKRVDREKGLEAGADYYLAKGSFQDETLVEAVKDLIGEASEPCYPPTPTN
ncbi:MAG: hybrid sensor histidine kinase/response regulator [Deltaproteobacteria bacterium]